MKKNYYIEALKVLEELHEEHPTFTIARHVATATSDYGDIWGMTGKEFLFALQRYQSELCLDSSTIDEEYVKQIIEDASHLNDKEDEYGNEETE